MRIYIFCLLSLFFSAASKAKTWRTAYHGKWTDTMTWAGKQVPPFTSTDSFIISHYVSVESNLRFSGKSIVQIESTGGLCGYFNFTAASASWVNKYGILFCDSLFILGGKFNAYQPGLFVMRKQVQIKGPGGGLSLIGCSMYVGNSRTFDCVTERGYMPKLSPDDVNPANVSIGPNPTSGIVNIYIENSPGEFRFRIFNLSGQLVFDETAMAEEKGLSFQPELANGIYVYSLIFPDGETISGKLQIER